MKILSKVQIKGVVGDPSSIEGALTIPTSTNLKTINSTSLIGTGNIYIAGGEGGSVENLTLTTLTLGPYQVHYDDVSNKLQIIYAAV